MSPLVRSWKKRSERIAVLKRSLEKGDVLVDREMDLTRRWNDTNERSLTSEMSVAENRIMNSVSDWAGKSGLEISSLKPRRMFGEKDFQKLEFRLSATGDLESVTRFPFELETDPLSLNLEDLEITARDNEGRNLALTVRFTGLILVKEAL